MMIDGHSHVTLPIEEHIKEMDKVGVDKTILFSTSFHPERAKNTPEIKAAMTYLGDLLAGRKGSMIEVRQNSIKELMAAIKQYPTRYIGFGAVPLGLDYQNTMDYVKRNIIDNHLKGMGEFTPGTGQVYLLENIFKVSSKFGNLPIWIHAFFPLGPSDIREVSEYAKQYPEVPIILGHLGGSNWLETMELAKELPNLYLDTSAFYSTFVLGAVINEVPEKCIFGVDRPFGDLELSKAAILKVAKTPAIAAAVLGENVMRLLDIE